MNERIVIVGAGRTGRLLAERLAARYQVVLLDKHFEAPVAGQRVFCAPEESGDISPGAGLTAVQGDATSRLLLKSLYLEGARCALAALAGTDEVNLEVCRLGHELGFQPIVALARDGRRMDDYRQTKAVAMDGALLLADHQENSLRHRGAIVPVGIGQGKGELLEINVLATSPLVGRPLKDLAPHRWRVAAVFRGQEVQVPTGDTVVQAGDRVLLVGDPKILTALAEHLRMGRPQFPRPFGPNVVTLEFAPGTEVLAREAEALACSTAASGLVRGIPGAADHEPFGEVEALEAPECRGQLSRLTFDLRPFEAEDFELRIMRQLPGVVVVPARRRRGRLRRLWAKRENDAALCDRLAVPVLFSRGTFPYRRILLPVSDSALSLRAAEVAIDLTRQLASQLTVLRVDLPDFLSGQAPGRLLDSLASVQRLCQLYEVRPDYLHRVGNPVRQVAEESRGHQLLLVARHQRRRDTFFDPDVALEMALQATCSVLVVTVRPEG